MHLAYSNKNYLAIIFISLLVITGIVFHYLNKATPLIDMTDGTFRYSGRITALEHGCGTDGFCKVVVNDTKTIIGCGMVMETGVCPRIKIDSFKLNVGDQIYVRAKPTPYGYSLDCDDCSFEVENNSILQN